MNHHDAEIDQLKQERDQLKAEVERLRNTSRHCWYPIACEFVSELEQERDQIQAEVERLRALWEKETERAHVAEGELLKIRVRLVTTTQERDQLLNAVEGFLSAPKFQGHALKHPDPEAERKTLRHLAEVFGQLRQQVKGDNNE